MVPPNCLPVSEPDVTGGTVVQTTLVTVAVLSIFLMCRTVYEHIRQQFARVTVVIIGAGPIGLLSALLASQNQKVNRVILYEEKSRRELLARHQQVALNSLTVKFVKTVGIDLDSLEGCWHNKCFLTPIAVFQEYLLERIYTVSRDVCEVDVKLNCKVSITWVRYSPCLRVVCIDGAWARVLLNQNSPQPK